MERENHKMQSLGLRAVAAGLFIIVGAVLPSTLGAVITGSVFVTAGLLLIRLTIDERGRDLQ